MEIPKEVSWIGPLFAVVYILLWLTRGPAPFFMLFFVPLVLMVFIPPFLVVVAITIFYLYKVEKHRFILIIFILSFFSSGILMQPIHIPHYGPYPPLPDFRFPMIMTPFSVIFILLFQPLSTVQFPVVVALVLLMVLPTLTVITIYRVSQGKLSAGSTILVLVLILLVWTLLVIPVSTLMSYYFFTPIPLGPLVALNILPKLQIYENPE